MIIQPWKQIIQPKTASQTGNQLRFPCALPPSLAKQHLRKYIPSMADDEPTASGREVSQMWIMLRSMEIWVLKSSLCLVGVLILVLFFLSLSLSLSFFSSFFPRFRRPRAPQATGRARQGGAGGRRGPGDQAFQSCGGGRELGREFEESLFSNYSGFEKVFLVGGRTCGFEEFRFWEVSMFVFLRLYGNYSILID